MSKETSRRGLLSAALGTAGLLTLGACSVDADTQLEPMQVKPVAIETVPAPEQKTPTIISAASLDDPRSLTVIVNKQRPLNPQNYQPDDLVVPAVRSSAPGQELLRACAAEGLTKLAAAAAANGTPLTLVSGFRSFNNQIITYNSWVSRLGKSNADSASARPGFSEHQTGLAADIGDSAGCNLQSCFAAQPLALWVKDHCHEFGFVVRYQPGLQETTGFYAEPWHLRYLGTELATAVVRSGVKTLEEHFGLPSAPDYL